MVNRFKFNKSFINTRDRKKIKEEYFYWANASNLAKKYWYTVYAVNKYLNWSATKIFKTSEWIIYRRCNSCTPLTYKLESDFFVNTKLNWKNIMMTYCKSCHYRKVKNKRILAKNLWDDRFLKRARKSWDKNKWKYNIRRRILRIIWYLDSKWKIIKKELKLF